MVARVTAGLAESNGSLPPTHVTCRLTAQNRDKLRNHTLGNRVGAPFFIHMVVDSIYHGLFKKLYLHVPISCRNLRLKFVRIALATIRALKPFYLRYTMPAPYQR